MDCFCLHVFSLEEIGRAVVLFFSCFVWYCVDDGF